MKAMLVAAVLSFSLFAANVASAEANPQKVVVIYAVSEADAQQQIAAIQYELGTDTIIYVIPVGEADSLQRGVGTIGVVF